MELLVPHELTYVYSSSFSSFPGNPSPLCMVLESHFVFGGEGKGGDVLSSNPLAATSPGTNKIGIGFG